MIEKSNKQTEIFKYFVSQSKPIYCRHPQIFDAAPSCVQGQDLDLDIWVKKFMCIILRGCVDLGLIPVVAFQEGESYSTLHEIYVQNPLHHEDDERNYSLEFQKHLVKQNHEAILANQDMTDTQDFPVLQELFDRVFAYFETKKKPELVKDNKYTKIARETFLDAKTADVDFYAYLLQLGDKYPRLSDEDMDYLMAKRFYKKKRNRLYETLFIAEFTRILRLFVLAKATQNEATYAQLKTELLDSKIQSISTLSILIDLYHVCQISKTLRFEAFQSLVSQLHETSKLSPDEMECVELSMVRYLAIKGDLQTASQYLDIIYSRGINIKAIKIELDIYEEFKNWEKCKDICNRLLKMGHKTADVYATYCYASYNLREYLKVFQLAQEGLEVYPHEIEIRLNLAVSLTEVQAHKLALEQYRLILDDKKDCQYALLGEIYALSALEHEQAVLQCFKNPDWLSVTFDSLDIVRDKVGVMNKYQLNAVSEKMILEKLKYFPEDINYWILLTETYLMNLKAKQHLHIVFDKILKQVQMKEVDYDNLFALLYQSSVHEQKITNKIAYRVLKQGLKKYPESELLLERMIMLLISEDRYDHALTVVEAMLKKKPNDLDMLLYKADIYIEQGELNEAIEVYDLCEKLHGLSSAIAEGKRHVYETLGLEDESQYWAEQEQKLLNKEDKRFSFDQNE